MALTYKCCALWWNTTKQRHDNHARSMFQCWVNRESISMNANTKKKVRNKRFNEVRQLAYVLGTEWRRFYSNNWVTRLQIDLEIQIENSKNSVKQTNLKTLKYNWYQVDLNWCQWGCRSPPYIAREFTKNKPKASKSDQKRIQNQTRRC